MAMEVRAWLGAMEGTSLGRRILTNYSETHYTRLESWLLLRWCMHKAMTVFLAVCAKVHFSRTKALADMIPPTIGNKAKRLLLVRVVGVAMLTIAILLQVPSLVAQGVAGYGACLLFLAIFPANVHAYVDGQRKKSETLTSHVSSSDAHTEEKPWLDTETYNLLRLPLQLLLFGWAYYVSPGILVKPVNPKTAFDFVGDLGRAL